MKIIITLLLFSTSLLANNTFVIKGNINYLNHNMSDLKGLLNTLKDDFPLDGRITDNFPSYFLSNISAGINVTNNTFIGLSFSGSSTGARFTYSDQTGSYVFDNKVNSYSWGTFYEYNNKLTRKIEYDFNISVGILLSYLNLYENVQLIDFPNQYNNQNGNLQFLASSLFFDPGASIYYSLFNNIKIGINANYIISFPKTFRTDNGLELRDTDDNAIKSQWSGLRYGLLIKYII